eukprot:CAMPEP_0201734246 /NCGR_PEP_ID=MMETSP0593-20130828/33698_1 /ASSEMBLY_ACC=CAM_ASM_000672 /TAXON_ID=267983 /ORGANISM="Skeletonema japonicum, Strain CCMP2506" /LENGTH=307 /DNA_ID=CAMNT_0048227541 /DNA_START=244 /DNA_END=1163 /DNA_ORIENTATION=-
MTIDWSIHNDAHTRYCGPRTVGGYSIAKKYCSPQTACGTTGPVQGIYGGNGNDCKGRNYFDVDSDSSSSTSWMCFADIECVSPSYSPSGMPTDLPSGSVRPSGENSTSPSVQPSTSSVPSIDGRTGTPTKSPSVSPTILPSTSPTSSSPTSSPQTFSPTGSPVEISTIKIRGYFCGFSYDDAVENCDASKSCNSNADCNNEDEGEECYPNVSCEFVASEASELGDHVDVVVVVDGADDENADDGADGNVDDGASDNVMDDNAGDNAVLKFSNGGDSSSSLGFVCGVKGALVSLGLSVSVMLFICTMV